MPNQEQHQHRDRDPTSQPLPSIGSPPSPTYASKAAGIRNMHKLKLHPVFTDPAEGHLAAAALAPKGARLGDLVNPRAVAYIAPRTISPGAFSDATRSTHSTLFQTQLSLASGATKGTIILELEVLESTLQHHTSEELDAYALHQDATKQLLNAIPPQAILSDQDSIRLQRDVTPEEIDDVVSRSPLSKALGKDGLPFELYRHILLIP
ncbi:hypothetical protein K457DRAFT_1910402 [Linnemannia elongata AG-77]|uniref:Uncharacterized protein n=1 Tax=Linnemannia elongata AG-77 TaxID=1314771 RepID=A0A197JIW4_9FUNG|nr:hypothetical protein K457DRAFT_1910402 [Linnemannia elongata AG-77]